MKLTILYFIAGLTAYLVAGVNPAILLSKLIYHEDIRTCGKGSGNPGFTNFKRVYGGKWAWLVMVLDIGKCVALMAVFGTLFKSYAANNGLDPKGLRQIGIAYVMLMASIGHDFPVWYGFKGGKGFLVNMAAVWFLDWRAGIMAFAILCLFLFTLKYMSLATMIAILSCPVMLLIHHGEPIAIVLSLIAALLMVYRHKENIGRLMKGEESKFSFFKK